MLVNIELDTNSNVAYIVKDDHGIKSKFPVDVSTLFESIEFSKDRENSKKDFKPIRSIIHQKEDGHEIIQSIQIGKNSFIYIVKVDKKKVPFYIYDKFFGFCGMPTLLFAIKVVNNFYSGMNVTVLENDSVQVTMETQLFRYPFSNVGGNGHVCTGMNKLSTSKIEGLQELKRIIGYFYEMPNTSESYNHLNNAKQLQFRELAKLLSNNDFDSNLLVDNTATTTYKDWLNKL